MADFDAQLPVRALAVNFTTEVANAAGTTINPAEDYAQGSTTSGENGILTLGATTTAAPTYTTLTSNPLSLDTSGNLRVTLASSVVNATGTLTNNSAAPIADNLGVLPAIASAAAPTWTTGFQVLLSEDLSGNLRVITGSGSTTAVTGNVTVVQPTGTNLHAVIDSGTITITPSGTQNENLIQVAGVTLGSTAVTNYGTTPAATAVPGVNAFVTNTVAISAASLPLPTGASTSALQTTGNTSLATIVTNTNSLTLAQGSTTSGQTGNLAMGAVTTAAPVYVTGQTDPLSLDTAGNLRVAATLTSPAAVLTYFTDAAVASGGTVTHSLAGPITLDAVHGSGSGEIKMTVAIGVTASEVTYWQGFTSSAVQNCEFALKNGYVIAAGSSVKVTIKNRDLLAQDVYLTIVSH